MPLRHFLEVDDLDENELIAVLDAAEKPAIDILAKKGVALIFEKPSLRTRNSAEMAVVSLGGHPAYITDAEISLDDRESVEDAIRTLNGYYHVFAARVFAHSQLERMVSVSKHPVVNLLSDSGHPVQALADLLTIRQSIGTVRGLTIAWIGDFSNVARSLSLGAAILGASFRFAGPREYAPTETDIDRFKQRANHGATISVHDRADAAVADANVVTTDTWYSMGQEDQRDIRRRAMEGWTVDDTMMALADEQAIFLHCLPVHRGEEASASVVDGAQSKIWIQAHNRLHSIRGLFVWLHAQGAIV
jgi:ornithine carbamoyltransferase